MSIKHTLAALAVITVGTATLTAAGKPDQTGAESSKKPVSASIIDAANKNSPAPAGNVQVKYADGTTDKWTTKGIAMEPKVAADGTVGWYLCATNDKGKPDLDQDSSATPVALVVCKAGKILATIKDLANPRGWGFDPDGSHVIVYEGAKHGPGWVRRFDLKTGKETDQFSFADTDKKCPAWAKPFQE